MSSAASATGPADDAAGPHLCEIPHPAQQPVGDARRAAGPLGDADRAVGLQLQLQDARAPHHDPGQLLRIVELQALHDAEAVAQRRGQQARAGGGADQRERRQVELDGTGARSLADHEIELRVLHGGIENLLHHRAQAMDFVDEQHVARLEIGQEGGQVARPLEHRTRGLAQVDLELVRDDVRQGGLAEARRPEDQHVIQRLAPHPRRLDRDPQELDDLRLSHVIGHAFRSHRALDGLLVAAGGRGDDPIRFDAHARILMP